MLVTVKVLFFAKAREIVGKPFDFVSLPSSPAPYADLLEQIIANYHGLEQIKDNVILALNQEYCDGRAIITLKTNDEIAVIPPLSGG